MIVVPIKSAVAFFFLFFLHGFSIGNGQQGISYNWCTADVQRLGSMVGSAGLCGLFLTLR
jgi:hypothetical protein